MNTKFFENSNIVDWQSWEEDGFKPICLMKFRLFGRVDVFAESEWHWAVCLSNKYPVIKDGSILIKGHHLDFMGGVGFGNIGTESQDKFQLKEVHLRPLNIMTKIIEEEMKQEAH